MLNTGAVIQWTALGVLIVTIGWMVKHQAMARRDFLTFLTNHMSRSTEVLEGLAKAVNTMSIRIEKCPGPKEDDDG